MAVRSAVTRLAPARLGLLLLALGAAIALGCSGGGPSTGGADVTGASSEATGAALEGSITVSAASSLTEAFTQIGEDFAVAEPGVDVVFSFQSSSSLASQIVEGAPADVFASADEATMADLVEADLLAGAPVVFARNELVIVTKPGNPEDVGQLGDLEDVGIVSLCGEDAPCGRYATQVLDAAGVSIPASAVTRGQNVTAALTAVAEGDAAAGIVYASDAGRAGESVESVAIPQAENVVARYPIGVLASTRADAVASAFVQFVLGEEGQAVLVGHGFLSAP